ncbi:MAG TPA: zinc ribbon domain-containing protein [Ktedonobacteraceae bacterium]
MAQSHQHYCQNCGTPAVGDERFCTNCGAPMNAPARPIPPPPTQYPQNPQAQQQMQQVQQPGQYYQAPPINQQVPPYAQQPQSKQNPIVEAFAALGLLFLFRRSIRRGYTGRYQRRNSGCCGVLVAIVILGILAAVVYNVYRSASASIRNANLNSITSSNGSGSSNQTTQPPITTTKINQTVTYSGVNITIVDVQQSKSFLDDSSTTANGMIRVNIKEANNSGSNASYFYSDIAHVILPDKTSVPLVNQMQSSPPAKSITRDNWLDFAVPTSDKIDQLTLVLGTNSEAQISIPLTGNANLSAFQSKTANLNKPISYDGLNWTLQSATSSLSIAGKQASAGMRYVILTFKVDNSTSKNTVIGFTNEYMRLKAGGITNSPVDTTLPLYINASTSGVTGTVNFLMPENNTAYTLIFLAAQNYSNVQVNTDFTI